MSRNKTHVVTGRRKDKRMVITVEQQLKMDRAARRQAAIESGITRPVGTGAHGGDDTTRNRRDRRDWRQKLRSGGYDE